MAPPRAATPIHVQLLPIPLQFDRKPIGIEKGKLAFRHDPRLSSDLWLPQTPPARPAATRFLSLSNFYLFRAQYSGKISRYLPRSVKILWVERNGRDARVTSAAVFLR